MLHVVQHDIAWCHLDPGPPKPDFGTPDPETDPAPGEVQKSAIFGHFWGSSLDPVLGPGFGDLSGTPKPPFWEVIRYQYHFHPIFSLLGPFWEAPAQLGPQNGPKRGPKWPKNGWKWPKMAKNGSIFRKIGSFSRFFRVFWGPGGSEPEPSKTRSKKF